MNRCVQYEHWYNIQDHTSSHSSYSVFVADHRVERWHRLALPSLFGSIFGDRKPGQQTSYPTHKPDGLLHGVLGEEDDADSDTIEDTKTVVGVDEVRGGSKIVPDLN